MYELVTKKTRNYINQLPSIIKKYANIVEILIIQGYFAEFLK